MPLSSGPLIATLFQFRRTKTTVGQRSTSAVDRAPGGPGGVFRLLIRKQLCALLAVLWLMDVASAVDPDDAWLSRKVAHDIGKSMQGAVTCCVLVFKPNVTAELQSTLDPYKTFLNNLAGRPRPRPRAELKF